MAQHYVIVLVPQQGGWRAHFPDSRGCRADGARVEAAIDNATREVSDTLDGLNHQGAIIPPPKSYEEVRDDNVWAAERGIDWSTAVISMVQIA
jgi:predicted RNase H-like HicB family nuclease